MTQLQMSTSEYKQLLRGKNIKEEPGMSPAPRRKAKQARPVTPSIRKRVREINTRARQLLDRVSPLCYAFGWHCDTARHFTVDSRDKDFPSISDNYATPNCIVIWRKDDVFFPFGRMKTLLWLWEDLDNRQVLKRLNELQEVRAC